MTMFTIQELTISGIYLWEVGRFLRVIMELHTRKLLYELLMVNIMLIILDVVLLSVEYENLYQIEVTLKGMVYSIKLKMELAVLSKLVKVMTDRKDSFMVTNPDQEVDMKRFASSNTADILTSRNEGEGEADANSEEKCESPASPNSRTNLRHEFFKMASNYRRGRTNSTPSQRQKSPAHSPAGHSVGRPFPSTREKPNSRNGGSPHGVSGIDHQYFSEKQETDYASPRAASPPPPNPTMTHPSMHAVGTISWAHGGGPQSPRSQATGTPPCPPLPEMERTSSVTSTPHHRQSPAQAAPQPQRSPSLLSGSGDSASQRSGSMSNAQAPYQQGQRTASVYTAGGTPSRGVLNGPNDRINPGLHLPALPLPTAKRRSSISEMYPGKLGDEAE